MSDPFAQFSLCPFQFEDDADDADDSPSSGSLPSRSSSLHSTHDEGLVSTGDPKALDFLLCALAMQDQEFAAQQHQQAPPRGASKAPSSQLGSCTGSSNGLCTLTRTCAGALDAMLPSDCDAHAASRDAQGQQRAAGLSSKQQKNQQPALEQQGASVHMHRQWRAFLGCA